MSHFDLSTNSSPDLGLDGHSVNSHLRHSTESGYDSTQEPPVVVHSEGRADITATRDDSVYNDLITHVTFLASDQQPFGLGDYSAFPPSPRIENIHAVRDGSGGINSLLELFADANANNVSVLEGIGGFGGIRSLLEPFADADANNVLVSGGIAPSLTVYSTLSIVCFSSHFLIY